MELCFGEEEKMKNCFPFPFHHFAAMLYYSNSGGKRDVGMHGKAMEFQRIGRGEVIIETESKGN